MGSARLQHYSASARCTRHIPRGRICSENIGDCAVAQVADTLARDVLTAPGNEVKLIATSLVGGGHAQGAPVGVTVHEPACMSKGGSMSFYAVFSKPRGNACGGCASVHSRVRGVMCVCASSCT